MGATATPKKADVAVAYSGGRDSTALLHAVATAAVPQGLRVAALHVHHGLSRHADAWLAHAQAQCQAWAQDGLPIQLYSQRLQERPAAGESVEAWARQARYRALRQLALQAGASTVLLAQHRRDQAETLLLQALRGAGVAGLAGMPACIERDGLTWLRPWLQQPREAIDAYVRHHRLSYVDDDSNADVRFARNRLRHDVWPALTQAFAQAESALADAATWAGEAAGCLAELAAADLSHVAGPSGLRVSDWQTLSHARQGNVLRAWLKAQSGSAAPAALVTRLRSELPGRGDAQWQISGGSLRRHRGRLQFVREAPQPAAQRETALSITRAGRYALPGWGGTLVARRVRTGGVPVAWLGHLALRARAGGEQFQPSIERPARSLKKQYQAADVPAWQRDAPLVYSGEQLVFVPGLGVDARVWALPGQAQLGLVWVGG